jgi:26S proteasome regulatory subunit N2
LTITLQPTGGPLLLHDTQPDEEKMLIDEKLKKVTTEKAPVAGQTTVGSSAGLTPRQHHNILSQALRASTGGDLRSLNELNEFLSRTRAAGNSTLANSGAGTGSGAAAAAGVLTAVDEDGEGDEEAVCPREFEYFTDAEDED